jgi:NADH-quinone oxidoreductase subunit G
VVAILTYKTHIMIQLEIDGKQIEVQEGTMLMEATKQAGQYVPHFCYHKKLSIAANCRMCLVEVEKAPKPLPACATPVTQGMKVFTQSDKAKQAQKSVMEFLLINHPLDCPICDQGGECQLQDLAVGYGKIESRYKEEKRIVFHKNIGPLVSMEEMSRCIHCTRCVRFGQEVAGVMELGMLGRGEHSEITTFLGNTVDSELSGNMIDICPVGALTSKPFRYSARTWELTRFSSIAVHDALGSNIIVQVKNNKVMRVLPQENESINECWISDKDRFSYDGLYHEDRIQQPMLKDDNGVWHEVEWQYALQTVVNKINAVKDKQENKSSKIGAFFNSNQTSEEIYLFKKLINGLGSDIIDFRLKHSFMDNLEQDSIQTPIGLNTLSIEDFDNSNKQNKLEQISFIGSFLRNDHPLLCARVRKASKQNIKINSINASSAQEWLMNINNDIVIPPYAWAMFLTQVKHHIYQENTICAGLSEPQLNSAKQFAANLENIGSKQTIVLGTNALYHAKRAIIHDLCLAISLKLNCTLVVLPDSANMLGAYHLGAFNNKHNSHDGLNAYFLMNIDIDHDLHNKSVFINNLKAADTVIALDCYISPKLLALADVILPIASSFETSGTIYNMQGKAQSFNGTTKPLGEARPAWKILRVLSDLFGIKNTAYQSSEEVKNEILPMVQKNIQDLKEKHVLSSSILGLEDNNSKAPIHFERISDISIYSTDAMVRRSKALAQTELSKKAQKIYANPQVLAEKGIKDGDTISLLQGQHMLSCPIYADKMLDKQVIRIPTASSISLQLDSLYGDIAIEMV